MVRVEPFCVLWQILLVKCLTKQFNLLYVARNNFFAACIYFNYGFFLTHTFILQLDVARNHLNVFLLNNNVNSHWFVLKKVLNPNLPNLLMKAYADEVRMSVFLSFSSQQ